MSARAEDVIAGRPRPFTGAEYLESLRDEREVWIYGERVDDVELLQPMTFRFPRGTSRAHYSPSNSGRSRRNRSSKKSVTTRVCGLFRTSRRVNSHNSRAGGISARRTLTRAVSPAARKCGSSAMPQPARAAAI